MTQEAFHVHKMQLIDIISIFKVISNAHSISLRRFSHSWAAKSAELNNGGLLLNANRSKGSLLYMSLYEHTLYTFSANVFGCTVVTFNIRVWLRL